MWLPAVLGSFCRPKNDPGRKGVDRGGSEMVGCCGYRPAWSLLGDRVRRCNSPLDAQGIRSGEVDPLGNQFAELTVHLERELLECAAFAIDRKVAGAEIRNLLDDRGIVLLHVAPPWVGGRLSSFNGLSSFCNLFAFDEFVLQKIHF